MPIEKMLRTPATISSGTAEPRTLERWCERRRGSAIATAIRHRPAAKEPSVTIASAKDIRCRATSYSTVARPAASAPRTLISDHRHLAMPSATPAETCAWDIAFHVTIDRC